MSSQPSDNLLSIFKNRRAYQVDITVKGGPEALGSMAAWMGDNPDGLRVLSVEVYEPGNLGEGKYALHILGFVAMSDEDADKHREIINQVRAYRAS